MRKIVTHASLFSGIGGFDLAATWMGWDNKFQVEISPFCNNILAHQFPLVRRFTDIKEFVTDEYRGSIDVLSAGFPCQPFSTAGKRQGRADNRFLWPQTIRVIREIRPRWIVLENVAGLLSILEPESLSTVETQALELFSEGKLQRATKTILRLQRRIIGTILTDIREAGYILPRLADGTPVILCIPACAVGAPHRRDRLWFVAHADGVGEGRIPGRLDGTDQREERPVPHGAGSSTTPAGDPGPQPDADTDSHRQHQRHGTHEEYQHETRQHALDDLNAGYSPTADTDSNRQQGLHDDRIPSADLRREKRDATPAHPGDSWAAWSTQPPLCSRNDGVSPDLDGITFSKWRRESIHAYGNAIVPQVAFTIFQAINETGFANLSNE